MSKIGFYFHYFKGTRTVALYCNGKSHHVKHIDCRVPVQTIWNEDKQPTLAVGGVAESIDIRDDVALIK